MTDSYVALFLNSAIANDPMAGLSIFFLFLARIFPIIMLSPFFGARVLPHPVKVMLGISLFVIFLPQLLTNTTKPIAFNLLLIFYMVKELFIGLIIGNLISMPFVIAQGAGIIIDHQRGGASLMVNDPTIQNQSSPLGTLFNMVLIYVFYAINGPWDFLNGFSLSLEIIPLDQFINPIFFREGSPPLQSIIALMNDVMVMTTQLATPALIAILMTDSFLGIANRLAPQVQITFLGMPLKSLLGLTVVCLGWRLLVTQMTTQSNYWIQRVKDMVLLFGMGE